MANDYDDISRTRNPAFKTDLDLKIIKGLSLARVPIAYGSDGKLVFEANPKKDKDAAFIAWHRFFFLRQACRQRSHVGAG